MSESSDSAQFKTARFLTLIAILPQAFFLVAMLTDRAASWTAPVAAFAYAAFILSFLGGYWWGVALVTRSQKPNFFLIAILPMLLAFALFMPWVWGWNWPGSQLVALGIAIMVSFVVDWRMLQASLPEPGWIRVRFLASIGLGLVTILIGALTLCRSG
jgi:hypothetical protein